MAALGAGSILGELQRAMLRQDRAGMTDGELLRCFVSRRNEAAFEALLRRHGPMVRGVCRRILRNGADVDDAFQATFLVLLRKATDLAAREVIGDWLHGVALRTALKARTIDARRRAKERKSARREAQEEKILPGWRILLDQEISRLPEKYRLPVVLCHLEGRTQKEAAQQLRWPPGTVSARLARARALLARRLTRQGVILSAAALVETLREEALARLPVTLVQTTFKTAVRIMAGQAVSAVPRPVAVLTEGVVKMMLFAKLKKICVLGSAMFVLVAGLGMWGYSAAAGRMEEERSDEVPPLAGNPKKDASPIRPAPRALRQFQYDLRIVQVKDGRRKLVAEPRLLTQEGREVSFFAGGEQPVQIEAGKIEFVRLGIQVRLQGNPDEGGRFRLDVTINHSKLEDASKDMTIQTRSVRAIRRLKLGEPIHLKLTTEDKAPAVLEAEVRVWELEDSSNAKTDATTPARVGQILIVGNKNLTDSVILEELDLFPGQSLSDADLRRAERRLSQLKGVKSPPKVKVINRETNAAFKDIRITVEEK